MDWPLAVPSLLIEILLVLKPAVISGRTMFIAACYYISITNAWEDAYPYSTWTGQSLALTRVPFSDAYRFVD